MSNSDQLAAEFESIRKMVATLNVRLAKLEAGSTDAGSAEHPSLEKFAIAEAIANSVFGKEDKACAFEPNDKPCDHCSMCSSRGF